MFSRLIWFGLFSLIAIGSFASVRLIKGSDGVGPVLPAAIAAIDVTDAAPPLPKGDRLPSPFFDGPPREIPVAATKVVPIETSPKMETSNDDIVSWHWHEGSKVVRRRRAQ
jgi:hypothetical protein